MQCRKIANTNFSDKFGTNNGKLDCGQDNKPIFRERFSGFNRQINTQTPIYNVMD